VEDGMSSNKIPQTVKSPWSLQADYANPELYGWASIIVGIIALSLAIPILFVSAGVFAVAVVAGMGAMLVVAGFWMVKRGE